MKKIFAFFVCFTIVFSCFSITAFAVEDEIEADYEYLLSTYAQDYDVISKSAYKYIDDQADVLTNDEESTLNDKLTAFQEETELDLAVVLTTGVDNGTYYHDDRMSFADDYYDYNGYAKDGALLLVNIGDDGAYTRGNSWISTSGSCIDLISDDDISDIGYELTPLLESGNYYDAVNVFPDLVGNIQRSDRIGNAGVIALITIIVCVVIAFIYTAKLKHQLKSVSASTEANHYIVNGSLSVTRSYDHYLFSNVTKTERESSKGSSSHTSSSGSSHGGGGF